MARRRERGPASSSPGSRRAYSPTAEAVEAVETVETQQPGVAGGTPDVGGSDVGASELGRLDVAPDRAAAVMRRAAELEDAPDRVEPLDEEALVDIGRDLGLSPAAVRRAAAEVGAEAAIRRGRSGLVGPSVVLVGRVVDLDAPSVELRLAESLGRASFQAVRRRGGRSLWRQQRGVGARVATAVRHLAGREARGDALGRLDQAIRQPERRALADVSSLELVVEQIVGGGTVVRLTARLDDVRRGAVTASVGGVATGALMALGGVAGALAGPDALLALSGLGALVGGGAVAGAKLAYGRTVAQVAESLEGLLDRAEPT